MVGLKLNGLPIYRQQPSTTDNKPTITDNNRQRARSIDNKCCLTYYLIHNPGGVLWYFHTYVGSVHFFGFKILNFDIFWGFQKNKYFLGYENFVDNFFGVITKLDYI